MFKSSNGHEENDIHGHEKHHNNDDFHDKNNSNGHNEIEDEFEDDGDIYDEFEDEEKKEFKKLNDLYKVRFEELEDVNVGEIFLLSPLKPFKNLFKKNTLDIKKEIKNKINLTINPKIKILHLKRPINDILKTKKNKDINLNKYTPEFDENTLNLLYIENLNKVSGPYFDIIKKKKSISNKLFITIKNNLVLLKSINLKSFNYIKYFSYIFIFLFIFLSYGFFTKYKIENTLNKIQNFKIRTDITKIKSDLIDIKSDLIISNFLLKPIFFLNYFINNETLNNVKYALDGMQNIIDYSIHLVVIYDGVNNLIKQKGPSEVMYSELIKNIDPNLLEAKNFINNSLINFSKISDLGNNDLNILFSQKLDLIKLLNNYTNIFYKNKNLISSLLGDEKKRTYIIIFQNSDEIRPTGGFMGSVGFIEVYKGKILNFEKKDIYAIEWMIKNFNELSPEGLSSITDKFSLRDANYFIDIAESSNKIKSFLDKTNYKIDGIVYINQNIILDFLKNFGGIYFDKVSRDITSDNFSMIMSTLVESKITRTHTLATPKQILFDFIDVYFMQLKKAGKYSLYLKSIFDSIEKKDIIFYSFNKDENQFLSELGLIKNINTTDYLDFNYPVFTSISGNKSDRYIDRNFSKEIRKNPDCSISTNLKINSKHNFNIAEEINIKNFLYDMNLLGKVDLEASLMIQGKQLNKQYVRILLPYQSIIEENEKIKIKDLGNKKEVSFYLNTGLVVESDFNINYIIPNPECKHYNYLFIKQPGIKEYKLNLINDGNLILDSYLNKDYIMNK